MIARKADAEDAKRVAEIHVASWQTAFRGIMPDVLLDSKTVADSEAGWRKNLIEYPGSLRVIEDDTGMVQGFCCSGRSRSLIDLGIEGEIFGLHVAPQAKRCGYGFALVSTASFYLQEIKCRGMGLWTLEQNAAARKFYESIGGTLVLHATKSFGGRDLVEVAYIWKAGQHLVRGTNATPSS